MNTLISVKCHFDDEITPEVLKQIEDQINGFLGASQRLYDGRTKGKYVYFDLESPYWFDIERSESFIQGLVSGWLIRHGIEVL